MRRRRDEKACARHQPRQLEWWKLTDYSDDRLHSMRGSLAPEAVAGSVFVRPCDHQLEVLKFPGEVRQQLNDLVDCLRRADATDGHDSSTHPRVANLAKYGINPVGNSSQLVRRNDGGKKRGVTIADRNHGICGSKAATKDVSPVKFFDGKPRRGVKDAAVGGDDNRLSVNPQRFSKSGRVDEEIDAVNMNDIEIIDEAKP